MRELFQVKLCLLILGNKRSSGVRNTLVPPSILNLTFPPNVLWAVPHLSFFPQVIAFSLSAQLREALTDEKKIRSTKGEPEGAGLGRVSRWWSQQAVIWDGQSLVPASYLLHARRLSRGCLWSYQPPRWRVAEGHPSLPTCASPLVTGTVGTEWPAQPGDSVARGPAPGLASRACWHFWQLCQNTKWWGRGTKCAGFSVSLPPNSVSALNGESDNCERSW